MHHRDHSGCLAGMMEAFHNEVLGKELITTVFSRLKVALPTRKPWRLGEKATDVNPDLIASDSSFMTHCYEQYWKKGYETKTNGIYANEHFFTYHC